MKHPFSQMCCILGRGDAFISQEIASCEIKASGKMRSSQRGSTLLTQLARARNKSCAAKAVVRGVCEAHFCYKKIRIIPL